MKRNLFIICFLYSICSYSQVNDSFSDRNFTEKPAWIGNLDKFIVSPNYGMEHDVYGLQLNDKCAAEAYLSTPSKLVRGTTWEAKLYFYAFRPTSKSFVKFYLVASKSNLLEALNGYYLLFGGRDKNISLVKQQGNDLQTLVCGKEKSLSKTFSTVKVKVVCSAAGMWTLSTKIDDEEWTEEERVSEKCFIESNYAGIACTYSVASSSNVYFDDIMIYKTGSTPSGDDDPTKPDNPKPDKPDPDKPTDPVIPDKPDPTDVNSPKVLSIKVQNKSSILIEFNEDVVVKRAFFYLNLADKSIAIKCTFDAKSKKRLILSLDNPFEKSKSYQLVCTGIEDVNGNRMEMFSELLQYEEGIEESISFGSIVFSEIMANPNDVQGLPETEYLELYNRTEVDISLKRANLCVKGRCYPLPDCVIPSRTYLVLCSQKSSELWQSTNVSVVGLPLFPSLVNSGKLLWLEDSHKSLISWVDYSDRWYGDSKKRAGGWSLECVDINNLSNDEANWKASTDKRGGTPAEKNTVEAIYPDEKVINVQSVFMQTADTLIVNFSKSLNVSSLSIMENYLILTENVSLKSVVIDYPCGNFVKLALNRSMLPQEILNISISGLKDVSGNEQKEPVVIEAVRPQLVEVGDVQFNELLFNPVKEGAQYIELTNLSNKSILLNQLSVGYQNKEEAKMLLIPLVKTMQLFPPHSRMFFTNNCKQVAACYKCDPSLGVAVECFPLLSPQEGVLSLYSDSGDLIDKMVYSESMHSTTNDIKKGISLEKIEEGAESLKSSNWLSATFLSGYGTPGAPNRCNEQVKVDENVHFWLENSSLSLSSAENNCLRIAYLLSEEGFVGNVSIYDSSGREVVRLLNNEPLLSEGVIVWDGKEENGQNSRIGLYIAYVETHNAVGKVKIYKLPFAVVG